MLALKKHTNRYLENPRVKPDNVDFIEWLVKSVFDENQSGSDKLRIKKAIVDLSKVDVEFSDNLERAKLLSRD